MINVYNCIIYDYSEPNGNNSNQNNHNGFPTYSGKFVPPPDNHLNTYYVFYDFYDFSDNYSYPNRRNSYW